MFPFLEKEYSMRSAMTKIFVLLMLSAFPLFAQDTLEITPRFRNYDLLFGLKGRELEDFPRVGLALSGGGARGLSQIGVLAALEEAKIPICGIAGTSMGSIVGGLYASGYSVNQIKRMLFGTNWNDFVKRKEVNRSDLFVEQKLTEERAVLSFRIKNFNLEVPTSINTGQKIANFLNTLAINAPLRTEKNFDNLLVKYSAVATDLLTGEKIVFRKGELNKAMRASSSVSFLLPPVEVDSQLAVDGGLVENLPVKTLREMGCDVAVGVDVESPLRKRDELKYPWQIGDQIVSIPMHILTKQERKLADLVIIPKLGARSNMDFSNPQELFQIGYEAGKKAIPYVQKKIRMEFEQNFLPQDSLAYLIRMPKNPNALEKKIFDVLPKRRVKRFEIILALKEICDFNEYKHLSLFLIGDSLRDFRTLKIEYEENPVIKLVSLTGADARDYAALDSLLRPLEGKPYASDKISQALLNILRYYREKGKTLASINRVDFRNGTLTIAVSEGVIDSIKIIGNKRTHPEVILREIPMKPGQPFNIKKLERALKNLRSTNLFEALEAEIVEEKGKNILLFRVKEKIPGVLRFGVRADNENYVQLLADLRNENLFGTGTELGMVFIGGPRRRALTLEHKANRIFDTYLTYKISLYHKFNDVNFYKDDKKSGERNIHRFKTGEYRQVFTGVSIGFGVQTRKFGNLILQGKFEKDLVKNKVNTPIKGYKINISSLQIKLFIDSRDKYPFPKNGFLVNAYYEFAQKKFGGDVGYTKFFFDYKSFYAPSDASVVETALRFGFGDATLPLGQQFSIGGKDSFFGMREDEYRGRQIFTGSLGYRAKLPLKIFFDTYLKIRYDVGSIWEKREAMRFKDFRHGIGLTLSFDTPIGAADFSLGRSFIFRNTLKKNYISWSDFFFYFSIGYKY